MKNILVLLALLLLLRTAFPSMEMTGSIDSTGVATSKIKVSLPPAEGRTLTLDINSDVDSVTVKDKSGLVLTPIVNRTGNETFITVTVPYDYVEYDLVSDSFTTKNGSDWDFDLTIAPSEPVGNFNASLDFPPDAILKSSNGAVESTGDSIDVMWQGTNSENGQRIHLHTGYTLPLDNTIPIDPTLLIAGALIIFAAASMLTYMFTRRKPAHQQTASPPIPEPETAKTQASGPSVSMEDNSIFKTLDETDKEIIREIHNEGGKTTQARIYLNTHIPKATLSRRLSSMESKGLILRSQKGNRNLVTLGADLQK